MVVLPLKVFNQVVEFLMQQPYGQVSGMVEAIKENAQAVQSPAQEPEVEESDE